MEDTYCPIPWNFQAVRSNGDMRVCCQANISKTQGLLRKENGDCYNAAEGDLISPRNSSLIKEIRAEMLKGRWHSSCERCHREEKAGLSSRRKYEREQWSLSQEQVAEKTHSDGSIDPKDFSVSYYDLRFGNLCNLKCRMCGPTDSSAWYEDWFELNGTLEFKDTSGPVQITKGPGGYSSKAYDWHYSDEFWNSFEQQLPQIQHIYMAGGEPLLIKRHYEFLTKCVERQYSANMILEYNTNCTKIPDRALELWKHFKEVRIGASIDGYGEVAEYQRYPSRWNEVYANLQKLNAQDGPLHLWLAYTVTAYNVWHMPDFMKWKLKESGLHRFNGSERKPIITYHMAHNPPHLNVRVLPKEFKDQVVGRFENFVAWVKQEGFPANYVQQAESIGKSIKDYMLADDSHVQRWPQFKQYTLGLDKIRGQNISDLIPELSPFL